MPKLSERERLAKIEAEQRSLAVEAETVRRAVRTAYGAIAAQLAIETLTEREFRDILAHAIRIGGTQTIAVLKTLVPSPAKKSPERRPSDEHGGAARRRPASQQGAASAGDGPGN
jgi:hypothetical protein